MAALTGVYIYVSKQRFIETQQVNIVAYLFLAVFFLVYLTLSAIALIRQAINQNVFSRSIVAVRISSIQYE